MSDLRLRMPIVFVRPPALRLSLALVCPEDHVFEASNETQSVCPACGSRNVVPLERMLERTIL